MVTSTIPRQYTVAVGTSVVEIAPAIENKRIMELYLRNTSTGSQVISIGVGTEAVSGTGVVMQPGDVAAWSQSDSYSVPVLRYTAISSAVSGSLAVMYRLED